MKIKNLNQIKTLDPNLLPEINRRELGPHHSLYSHISHQFNGINILDIGTRNGVSAWAFKYDTINKVSTIDIKKWKHRIYVPGVEYIIDNCHNIDDQLLRWSNIILFDTTHNGVDETTFYNRLVNMQWKGMLLLDDIHLQKYGDMETFWQGITFPKWDLTQYGHSTGTGLVDFNCEVELS